MKDAEKIMNIKVELVQTKEYFENYYKDWLPRSKTKWLPWLGGAFK
jgi:hypothetical protein